MCDILPDYERFAAAGKPFGRAVVTSVWGSAPRPEGSCMLASEDGRSRARSLADVSKAPRHPRSKVRSNGELRGWSHSV